MDGELTQGQPNGAGFTLIELVVVVAVLSVLALGVGLATVRSGTGGAEADMALFRDAWKAQSDLAVAGHSRRGLSVRPEGLQSAVFVSGGWSLSEASVPWRKRAVLNAAPGPYDAPDIVFLANGQSTQFEIVFTGGNGPARQCVSDGWTGLSCGL